MNAISHILAKIYLDRVKQTKRHRYRFIRLETTTPQTDTQRFHQRLKNNIGKCFEIFLEFLIIFRNVN